MRRKHGRVHEDRGGVGNESTRDHIESNSKEDHVDTGGSDHRDQRAADEEVGAAVRERWIRWTVRPAEGKAESEAGAPEDGRESAESVSGEVLRFERKTFSREVGGRA